MFTSTTKQYHIENTLHRHQHPLSSQTHSITTATLHHHRHPSSPQTHSSTTNTLHQKKHTPSPQTHSITTNTLHHEKHTPSPQTYHSAGFVSKKYLRDLLTGDQTNHEIFGKTVIILRNFTKTERHCGVEWCSGG